MITLVKPSVKYKESFLAASSKSGKSRFHKRFKVDDDFDKYVEKINSYENGVLLKNGFVPETTFWIIKNEEYIGRVSIRHKLTKKMEQTDGHIGIYIKASKRGQGYGKTALKLALKKAHELGLNKVLMTCKTNNIPSRKLIESCDGELENVENGICRYQITLK